MTNASARELLAQGLGHLFAAMPHSQGVLAGLLQRHAACGCSRRGDLCNGCVAVLELAARLEGEGVTVDAVAAAVQVPFSERAER